MEQYLDFFNDYIMGIVQIFTGLYYDTKFLGKRIRLVYELLFVVCGALLMMAVRNRGINSFLSYVFILVVWGCLVCRAGFMTVALYAVLTAEIMQICGGAVHSILCLLNPFLFSFVNSAVSVPFMLLGNISIFAEICCCRMIERCFVSDESVNGKYAALILTPTLLIFLVSEYINYVVYGNAITTDSRGNVMNVDHVRMLVIQLLGMASLCCVMTAYKKLLENVRYSTELSLLRQQEHFMDQYVEEAKAHYESTKSFRHDIRNHITVVRELLQNARCHEAFDYVSDMEEITGEMSFLCCTGNPVVDILLGNKLGIAQSNGIDVHCSLTLPYPCPIRDIDFCIILSNALDNAICACNKMQEQKAFWDLAKEASPPLEQVECGKQSSDSNNTDNHAEKWIRVTGSRQGDFILIEIENSFQGGSTFREGTGLSNIRKVAEKYQGALNMKCGEGVVVLSVLLIIS